MSTRCVLLASKNPGKIRNFTMAFAELGIACRPVDSVTALKIEEHAVTPEENALLKARAHWQPGTIVLGDDAGLEIDALGGSREYRPGGGTVGFPIPLTMIPG